MNRNDESGFCAVLVAIALLFVAIAILISAQQLTDPSGVSIPGGSGLSEFLKFFGL